MCPFMIPGKNRPCKRPLLTRPDGTKSAYCNIHAYIDSPDLKYVECPYEPNNMMPEHELEKHLLVCTKAGQIDKTEKLPYFSAGINFQRIRPVESTSTEEKKEAPKPFGYEQKDDNKLDDDSTKLFIDVIEKAYAKLKVEHGESEEFKDLFSVDE